MGVQDNSDTPKCTLLFVCDITCRMMSRSTFGSDTVLANSNSIIGVFVYQYVLVVTGGDDAP
jgi:hypothetical protein